MPVWKQSRRVKVDFEQLRLWYEQEFIVSL